MFSVIVECDGWSKVFDIQDYAYHQGRLHIMIPSALCAAYLPGDVIAEVSRPAYMTAFRTSRSCNNMTIFEVQQ